METCETFAVRSETVIGHVSLQSLQGLTHGESGIWSL